jgi:hypothetical protein
VVTLESLQVRDLFLSLDPVLFVKSIVNSLRSRSVTCDRGFTENLSVYPLWICKEKFLEHVAKTFRSDLIVSLDSFFPQIETKLFVHYLSPVAIRLSI